MSEETDGIRKGIETWDACGLMSDEDRTDPCTEWILMRTRRFGICGSKSFVSLSRVFFAVGEADGLKIVVHRIGANGRWIPYPSQLDVRVILQ